MTVPPFAPAVLEELCNILADTSGGLSGSEIGRYLRECGIDDPDPKNTKRIRLRIALLARQQRDACGNNTAAFIRHAMDPARFTRMPDAFERMRGELNVPLAMAGLSLGDDGQLRPVQRASNLSEASTRADRLRAKLRQRAVHPDVLAACRAELLQDNYFHAVLEATKSLAEKLRKRTGLGTDGADLVDTTFGLKAPLLAFNTLRTDTERSEQTGLANLMKGMFSAFRNPTAHAPRTSWPIDEADALDTLSLVSLLHRRVDAAVSTRPTAARP